MLIERFILSAAQDALNRDTGFYILIQSTGDDTAHLGMLFRDDEDDTLFHELHLAWHHKLQTNTSINPRWSAAITSIPEERIPSVIAICTMISKIAREGKGLVPYGVKHIKGIQFNKFDGSLISDGSQCGLTCSTFVCAVLESIGIELLEVMKWPSRISDIPRQKTLVSQLQRLGAEKSHVETAESEIGSPRIRPEEVIGSCFFDWMPVSMPECELAGFVVMSFLNNGNMNMNIWWNNFWIIYSYS